MLDTSHLDYYIWDDSIKDLYTKARDTINYLGYQSDEYHTMISQLSIGEFKNTLSRRMSNDREKKYECMTKLVDLIDRVHADLKPLSYEAASISIELQEYDKQLSPNDAFILSQSFVYGADYLITSDRTLLESRGIDRYIEEHEYTIKRRDKLE